MTKQARLAYWSGIVIAPLVFLAQLALAYALVPWACTSQHHGVLHAISAVALALSVAALAIGWREWKRIRAPSRGRDDSSTEQPRFLTLIALAIAALFTVAVVGVWFTQWVLGPCLG